MVLEWEEPIITLRETSRISPRTVSSFCNIHLVALGLVPHLLLEECPSPLGDKVLGGGTYGPNSICHRSSSVGPHPVFPSFAPVGKGLFQMGLGGPRRAGLIGPGRAGLAWRAGEAPGLLSQHWALLVLPMCSSCILPWPKGKPTWLWATTYRNPNII